MPDAHSTIEVCIKEVDLLQKRIKKSKSVQVRSLDETDLLKGTALAWFRSHRRNVASILSEEHLSTIDSSYRQILTLTTKSASRNKYQILLREVRHSFITIRSENIVNIASSFSESNDQSPDFSSIVMDSEMQQILESRWTECCRCIEIDAPLAATIMMGGLLETILLARINQLDSQEQIFTCKTAPKDFKTNKTLQLKDWALRNYIDVAHELNWISQTEKDLGVVLRDYRNYIHPFKQKSHGVRLLKKDAQILWDVSKSIIRQIINCVGT